MTPEERLKKFAAKLNKPIEQMEKEVQEIFEQEKQIHPKMPEDEQKKRATTRLFIRYKRELISPAKWFEGVVVGISDVIDIVANPRKQALDLYAKSPDRALELKYVQMDAEGKPVPLDRKEKIGSGAPNPNYLKPLPEHNYIRSCIGVVTSKDAKIDNPKVFRMIMGMRNESYKLVPPLFQAVKFRANISTKSTPDNLLLNPGSVTSFDKADIKLPDVITGILQGDPLKPFGVLLKDIFDWHKAHENDKGRVMITRGDVVAKPEVIASGNRRMIIWDEGLSDEDERGRAIPGITCFVPAFLEDYLDFDEESEVYIIGRTSVGRTIDPTTGARIAAGVNIGVMGIYATPERKIPLEESEIVPTTHEEEVAEGGKKVVEEGKLWP